MFELIWIAASTSLSRRVGAFAVTAVTLKELSTLLNFSYRSWEDSCDRPRRFLSGRNRLAAQFDLARSNDARRLPSNSDPFSRRSKKNSGGGGRDNLSKTSEHEVMEGSSQTTESSSRPSSGRGLRFGRFSRKEKLVFSTKSVNDPVIQLGRLSGSLWRSP